MRELKFRAWNGKEKQFAHWNINNDKWYVFTRLWADIDGGLDDSQIAEDEQYTGLKDKNGKEIYEGDIVRYAFEYPEGEWVEEVSFGKISDGEGYYHDYFLAWRTTDKDGDGHQSLLDLEGYCEVIGNIHENPELLGEKEE